MRYFPKILTYTATVLFACNVYALEKEPKCLPATVVAQAIFTHAVKVEADSGITMWMLMGDNFQYKGNEWNVIFGVGIPNVLFPEEALQEGQVYFSHIILQEPRKNSLGMCEYASLKHAYTVMASTPPIFITEET